MSGLMRSRKFGWSCPCCSSWSNTRASEKRVWRAEVDAETGDMGDGAEYDYCERLQRLNELRWGAAYHDFGERV